MMSKSKSLDLHPKVVSKEEFLVAEIFQEKDLLHEINQRVAKFLPKPSICSKFLQQENYMKQSLKTTGTTETWKKATKRSYTRCKRKTLISTRRVKIHLPNKLWSSVMGKRRKHLLQRKRWFLILINWKRTNWSSYWKKNKMSKVMTSRNLVLNKKIRCSFISWNGFLMLLR